jgi:hypothetical protein
MSSAGLNFTFTAEYLSGSKDTLKTSIDCKYCKLGFCSRCIVLEIHNCKGVEIKKENQKKELEKKLEFKPDKKFGMV